MFRIALGLCDSVAWMGTVICSTWSYRVGVVGRGVGRGGVERSGLREFVDWAFRRVGIVSDIGSLRASASCM